MRLDDIRVAIKQAEADIRRVDSTSTDLAHLLAGRLRHVNHCGLLTKLKKELADWNMHTGTWKKRK